LTTFFFESIIYLREQNYVNGKEEKYINIKDYRKEKK